MARRASRDASIYMPRSATQVSVRLAPVQGFFDSSTIIGPIGVASQVLALRCTITTVPVTLPLCSCLLVKSSPRGGDERVCDSSLKRRHPPPQKEHTAVNSIS